MSTAFQVSLTAYRRIAPTAITNSEVPIVIEARYPGRARKNSFGPSADLDSAWIRGGVIGSPPGFGPGRGGSNPPPGMVEQGPTRQGQNPRVAARFMAQARGSCHRHHPLVPRFKLRPHGFLLPLFPGPQRGLAR